MIPHFEIVRVLDGSTLISAESKRCRYQTRRGTPLDPGYFVVVWPVLLRAPGYDRDAKYFGPFRTRAEASTVLQRSMGDYLERSSEMLH